MVSCLSERRQRTEVKNGIGKEINYGVPQDTVLGPLSFFIYINDVINGCDTIFYADDTTLLNSGRK